MKIIKKVMIYIMMIIGGINSMSFALEGGTKYNPVSSTEDIKTLEGQESIGGGTKYLGGKGGKLKGILTPEAPEEYDTSLGYAMQLIQITINWLLGILAFISLIYTLYCGYLIFSSGADEGAAKKGKTGIKTTAIALAGIGLSWLIISAMTRFVQNIAEG